MKKAQLLSKTNRTTAGSQQPNTHCDRRTRRYWSPFRGALGLALAAVTIACGSPTPLDRATLSGREPAADASVDQASADGQPPTWCEIQSILALKCQRCHDSPARHGAPFALISYDDTQLLDKKGNARFERIAVVVEERSMPAQVIKLDPPVEPLQDEERATILDWCAQGGALTGNANCDPAP